MLEPTRTEAYHYAQAEPAILPAIDVQVYAHRLKDARAEPLLTPTCRRAAQALAYTGFQYEGV